MKWFKWIHSHHHWYLCIRWGKYKGGSREEEDSR